MNCMLSFIIIGNAMLDYTTPGNFSFSIGDLFLSVGEVTDPTESGLNMTAEGLEMSIVMRPIEALEVRTHTTHCAMFLSIVIVIL